MRDQGRGGPRWVLLVVVLALALPAGLAHSEGHEPAAEQTEQQGAAAEDLPTGAPEAQTAADDATATPTRVPTATPAPTATATRRPFTPQNLDAAGRPAAPNTTGVRYSAQVNKANANVHQYRVHQRDIEVFVEREGILTPEEEKERADWCAEAWTRTWEIFGGYAFPYYECVISDRLADPARGASGLAPWSRYPATLLKRLGANFKAVMAHEIFHAWNVGHLPFEELWIVEGMGQYYNDLIVGPELLVDQLPRYVRAVRNLRAQGQDGPLTTVQRSADTLAYYKGALVFYMLDLEINERSGGTKSFDNVLRRLYLQNGPRGIPPGPRPAAWPRSVLLDAIIAEAGAPEHFTAFFKDYVEGTRSIFEWRGGFLNQASLPVPSHPPIPY